MKRICFLLFLFISLQAGAQTNTQPYILVLGTAQDGGYPHMGCTKECCNRAWTNDSLRRFVVSFALIDPVSKKWWLFEATPDIKEQLQYFKTLTQEAYKYLPEGIFITHAHIGHYTGLMEFGREVMNTNNVPVYALPKLETYLETNGPWSQLVNLHNIALQPLTVDAPVQLSDNITVTAFTVPHRDEYSETAGFRINTGNKKYLFIPDINKWGKWDRSIVDEVKGVDVALLDATFYDATELPGRKVSEVPHPFVTETMQLFENESSSTKSKVYFIHLNHTNPLMWDKEQKKTFGKTGFELAEQGRRL